MAEPEFSFTAMMADVARLREQLAEVYRTSPPSPDREKLGQMIAQIEQGKAQAEKAYPEFVDTMTKSMYETRADVMQIQAEAAAMETQLQAEMAEFEACEGAAVPKPLPAEAGVYPNLHRELGDELLARFGKARPAPTARQDLGSVQDIWLDAADQRPIDALPRWDGPTIAREMLEALSLLHHAEWVRPSQAVSENAWEDWDNWDDSAS